MKYKALMLDVDGTTIPNRRDGLPTKKVTQAISTAKKKIHIGVATSRCLPIVKPVIQHLSLQDVSIVNGGGKIIDLKSNKILYRQPIANKDAQIVCEQLSTFNIPFSICQNDIDLVYSKDFVLNDSFMIYALNVDPELTEKIVNHLSGISSISLQRIPDWNPGKLSLTITHAMATKQHAILEVAKLLGIETTEIIGVGDGYNDFPLLMACGLKVAMGNAVPELKAIADYIAPPVEDDGVADVIEKFVLNHE